METSFTLHQRLQGILIAIDGEPSFQRRRDQIKEARRLAREMSNRILELTTVLDGPNPLPPGASDPI